MKLQSICERYAAFRKTLGERFEVNGRQLKAFCRAMGAESRIVRMAPERSTSPIVKESASDVRNAAPYIRRTRERIADASRSLRFERHATRESSND